MFPKSFLLLAALGQALEIRKGDQLRHGGEISIQGEPTVFNGVLTSVSVIEGNGCPAGSYHLAPIEPGKSISTVLELDPSIYYYKNSTSPGPVSCGVSFEFDFVIPEAEADLSFGTSLQAVTKYEEGDTTRETAFITAHDLSVRVLDEEWSDVLNYISFNEGAQEFGVGGGYTWVDATPGTVGNGSYSATISISTDGPGELYASAIKIGFAIWGEPSAQ